MNFFEQQDRARKASRWLLIAYAFATLMVAVSITASLLALTHLGTILSLPEGERLAQAWKLINWPPTLKVAAIIILTMAIVSHFKSVKLRQRGGAGIAESLGARLVTGRENDAQLKQLYNVVEEMAIASGLPVPKVYIIPNNQSINAFAAGYEFDDAVIGVTEGACTSLTRDELQGVIAHEVSHILYGDMRLNLQLIGTLYGILFFMEAGLSMVRIGSFIRTGYRRDHRRAGLAVGITFIVIGFFGYLLASIIKAAVSRQREFLADASAVQFTRNPAGIAGALAKVAIQGGSIDRPGVESVSHMFFAKATSSFSSLLSTHPSLRERIKRLDRSVYQGMRNKKHQGSTRNATNAHADEPASAWLSTVGNSAMTLASPLLTKDQVGNPSASNLVVAREFLRELPGEVYDLAHETYGARSLAYLCLLDHHDSTHAQKQLDLLRQHGDEQIAKLSEKLWPQVKKLGCVARVPLLDLAIPALKQMSEGQKAEFIRDINVIIEADGEVSVVEFVVVRILRCALFGRYQRRPMQRMKREQAISIVLYFLAMESNSDRLDERKSAYAAGLKQLSLSLPWPDKKINLKELDGALRLLDSMSPLAKSKLLDACLATISFNQKISVQEFELFRAVCDTIGCPLPAGVVIT